MYKTYDYQNFYSPDFEFSSPANEPLRSRGPPAGSLRPTVTQEPIRIVPVEYEVLKSRVDETGRTPVSTASRASPRSALVERFAAFRGSSLATIVSAEIVFLVFLFAIHLAIGDRIVAAPLWVKLLAIGATLVAIVYFSSKNELGLPVL